MNRRRIIAALACAMIAATCGAPLPSSLAPGPSQSLLAGGETPAVTPAEPWAMADVEQPEAIQDAPSLLPGYQCHPCHFLAENDFVAVGASGSRLVAVGLQEPPAQAIAFTSTDGARWTAVPGFTDTSGGAAAAIAANGARTVVVGNDPAGATAWASTGGSWTEAPAQADLLVPYAAGGMTAITPFASGFVAGGYRDDPAHLKTSAAVWRSDDGLTWHADAAPAGTFDGGRIQGLATNGGAIVAVGTKGDYNYGPAAAWRWTAAGGWQAARIEPGSSGAMRAVTATATGFVAVGLNGDDSGAMTWTSNDGLVWTAAPDQPSFHYFANPVRMQAVVATPSGLVAGGWRSDAGKGSAVTWTSTDGVTWQGPTWEDAFSGGQITGLVVDAAGVVAVGRTGYPDWNVATIWQYVSP